MDSKNQALLSSFTEYCQAHPELRFWQALRGWAEVNFIFVGDRYSTEWYNATSNTTEIENGRDTFYWEGKDK